MARRLLTVMAAIAALLTSAALPGAAGVANATSGSGHQVVILGGPMAEANSTNGPSTPTISLNWSGYAATSSGRAFNYVHSTFVQPAIKCPGVKDQWTSNWVGLDGFDNGTVEQDGTAAHCGGPGFTTPIYQAWYELFPAPSINVFRVNPGDVIDTTVAFASGAFTLTVSDLTTGKTASTSATCSECERSSAEWIVERPALCNNALTNCRLTELANFGTVVTGGAEARLDGGATRSIGHFTNYPIYMVDLLKRGFVSLDEVSELNGATFAVTWDRSGHTVPIFF